jgi:succinate dehydrogenase (ubiquinone) cytochrome b560 subunit
MFNRLTGIILSSGLYVFGLGYLAAPMLGIHMESAVLAASFAAWPVAAKVATKFFIALPFTFHSFNGLRHLAWDMAKQITNKQVQVTGWAVVGLSFVSAFYLAAFV